MSAIAFYLLGRNHTVSGSDRLFDNGGGHSIRAALEKAGARIIPQDGQNLSADATLVVSTAVENDTPELVAARALGMRIVHRSEALAELARQMRTIAVSGTSGKSTVTAMVFAILREAGLDPSVISGAVLKELSQQGLWGNAYGGKGDWLVIEADESDGSLVRYRPEIGLLLNIDRDHKELDELHGLFQTFATQSRYFVTHGDRPDCVKVAPGSSRFFGLTRATHPLVSYIMLGAQDIFCQVGDESLSVPFPGKHTLENALAALEVASVAGVSLEICVRALAKFAGVARRHDLVGTSRDVRVFDDFAHNPAKVEAGLAAAQAEAGDHPVLAIFQPHGYGPLRFLLTDFADSFARALRPIDQLWIAPVYDAGGTADRTIGSADLVKALQERGRAALCPATRAEIPAAIAAAATPGTVVYSMGARDPELPAFAKELLAALG